MTPRLLRYFFVFLLIIIFCQAVYSQEYTFVGQEGEIVRLVPEALDTDDDSVSFTYSAPFNESGEWQTTYDDSGEYTITITAFDGNAKTEENATIVITNVNRPPVITAEDFTIFEMEPTSFRLDIDDPDGDVVTSTVSSPFNGSFEWTPTFNDSGEYLVTITASDGQLDVTKTITVEVVDTNQPPVLTVTPIDDIDINEMESTQFTVAGTDPDGNNLTYRWFVDDVEVANGTEFTYASDYYSSGEHAIRSEVSDGEAVAANGWIVRVANINRPPTLNLSSSIIIHENESVVLDIAPTDLDDTPLTYVISEPIGDDGEWTPTFSDAGAYDIIITASDGELSITSQITLTVLDVDRTPTFLPIEPVSIREDELLRVGLRAIDPDGDDVTFYGEGLPNESTFDDSFLEWYPGYDFVVSPRGIISYLLGLVGYSRIASRPIFGTIQACGRESCSNQTIDISVVNVNRAPILDALPEIVINETSTAAVRSVALDPDGDYVSYYYGAPLNRFGRWTTNYSDSGTYSILVGASDGLLSSEGSVSISVADINRTPTFAALSAQNIRENETVSFAVPVFDPDGDDVLLWAEDMPTGASFNEGIFSWTPGYSIVNGSGTKTLSVTFAASSDEENIVKTVVPFTVMNVNRAPVITLLEPAIITNTTVGQPITFRADAFDPDGDAIHYFWKFGTFDTLNAPAVRRRFTTSGVKEIQLIVDDGDAESYATFLVNVGVRVRLAAAGQSAQAVPIPIQPVRPPQPLVPAAQPAEPTFVTFVAD